MVLLFKYQELKKAWNIFSPQSINIIKELIRKELRLFNKTVVANFYIVQQLSLNIYSFGIRNPGHSSTVLQVSFQLQDPARLKNTITPLVKDQAGEQGGGSPALILRRSSQRVVGDFWDIWRFFHTFFLPFFSLFSIMQKATYLPLTVASRIYLSPTLFPSCALFAVSPVLPRGNPLCGEGHSFGVFY